MKKENTVCKKDVCQKQTNYGENILVKSKTEKVTYIVTKASRDMFTNKKYESFFNMLEKLEKKLTRPLDFNVPLNYITLGAFVYYFDESDLKKIAHNIDIRIFEFLTDISLRKNLHDSKQIADKYLYGSVLHDLKKFYDCNYKFILECFSKKYSSLPLFDMLHQKDKPNSILSNIYQYSKFENNSSLKSLAYRLIVELENDEYSLQSESAREDLYYEIHFINKNFNKLTNEDVKCIKNITIENVFLFIQSKCLKTV